MPKSLQSMKRQLVRDAIFDAAIDQFAAKGFDETTVEEVAQAAGISRRSFFRYFESKDDLLAYSIVSCGTALNKKVAECEAGLSPLEVVRVATLTVAKQSEAWPRMQQMVQISERSTSAKQANLSRLAEATDSLAETLARHFKGSPKDAFKMRLLANLAFQVIVESTVSWSRGENQSISVAATQALSYFRQIFRDAPEDAPIGARAAAGKKRTDSSLRRASVARKR